VASPKTKVVVGEASLSLFFNRRDRLCKVKLILPAQPILPLCDPAYPVLLVLQQQLLRLMRMPVHLGKILSRLEFEEMGFVVGI